MNNCLTMGRGRWLCYAANAERRRRENEELERRPGLRPLVGRGVGPEPLRFLSWERPWEENFHRHLARGRSRPILTPRPFCRSTMGMCLLACHRAQQLDLAICTIISHVPLR